MDDLRLVISPDQYNALSVSRSSVVTPDVVGGAIKPSLDPDTGICSNVVTRVSQCSAFLSLLLFITSGYFLPVMPSFLLLLLYLITVLCYSFSLPPYHLSFFRQYFIILFLPPYCCFSPPTSMPYFSLYFSLLPYVILDPFSFPIALDFFMPLLFTLIFHFLSLNYLSLSARYMCCNISSLSL